MNILTKNVCVKQWLLIVMTLMSGYAAGAILAKLSTAAGF